MHFELNIMFCALNFIIKATYYNYYYYIDIRSVFGVATVVIIFGKYDYVLFHSYAKA